MYAFPFSPGPARTAESGYVIASLEPCLKGVASSLPADLGAAPFTRLVILNRGRRPVNESGPQQRQAPACQARCVPIYPSDDDSWNDVVAIDQHADFGQILVVCDFGGPVADNECDWAPIYEAAVEVCELPLSTVLRALGQNLIRWRVVQGERTAEVQLWLPDVAALPGAL